MDLGETRIRFLNLGLIEIPIRFGRILWDFRKLSSRCMYLLFWSIGEGIPMYALPLFNFDNIQGLGIAGKKV